MSALSIGQLVISSLLDLYVVRAQIMRLIFQVDVCIPIFGIFHARYLGSARLTGWPYVSFDVARLSLIPLQSNLRSIHLHYGIIHMPSVPSTSRFLPTAFSLWIYVASSTPLVL